eukprot:1163292-Prorocentrum_lima.AAC.1
MNKNDSQGSSFEAASGATKSFNKKYLPNESKAPICSCCKKQRGQPVSYTHLTLPTICSV